MNLNQQSNLILTVAYAVALSCAANSWAATVTDFDTSWDEGHFHMETRPLIVTASAPPVGGDRESVPGDPNASSGVDVDGVSLLFLDVNPAVNLGAICSGALLEDGRHVLTAAHCGIDPNGNNAIIDGGDGNFIGFETAGGNITVPFSSSDFMPHPLYDGDLLHGYDVAVIDTGAVQDSAIPRYKLNANNGIEGSAHLSVGYGESGDGATGGLLPAGTKRSGINRFETTGIPLPGISNIETQITGDFDSGDPNNDAYDVIFGLTFNPATDLGFGVDEVGTAPGDSGGPSLVFNGTRFVINGVHSYGLRLELLDGTTSDVNGALDSSFGEFIVDARIAVPAVYTFIHGVIGVPEPTTASLAMMAVGMLLRRERMGRTRN